MSCDTIRVGRHNKIQKHVILPSEEKFIEGSAFRSNERHECAAIRRRRQEGLSLSLSVLSESGGLPVS